MKFFTRIVPVACHYIRSASVMIVSLRAGKDVRDTNSHTSPTAPGGRHISSRTIFTSFTGLGNPLANIINLGLCTFVNITNVLVGRAA